MHAPTSDAPFDVEVSRLLEDADTCDFNLWLEELQSRHESPESIELATV